MSGVGKSRDITGDEQGDDKMDGKYISLYIGEWLARRGVLEWWWSPAR